MIGGPAADSTWRPVIPHLPPHVSLNRVRVVDLPGVRMDAEVRDRQASELIPARALAQYARPHAVALHLPPELDFDGTEATQLVPRRVAACLGSVDAVCRVTAEGLVDRLGRNLGHVLLALRRGDPANRAARPEWSDADWQRWASVRRVWLAGGLAGGELGRRLTGAARAWLAEADPELDLQVHLSRWGQNAAVIGAARYLPADAGYALCFDFGQTYAKRVLCRVEGRALVGLTGFEPVEVQSPWNVGPGDETARHVLAFVSGVIADSVSLTREAGVEPAPYMMMSVASYVDTGRILSGQYSLLNALNPDARPLLADTISAHTGTQTVVRFIHDGTAAATSHAGAASDLPSNGSDSAVIVIGTALGVGFPPVAEQGLLKLAFVDTAN